MAIFRGKPDAHLPLLTHLFQLDPSDRVEVMEWFEFWSVREVDIYAEEVAALLKDAEGYALRLLENGKSIGRVYDEDAVVQQYLRRARAATADVEAIVWTVRSVMKAVYRRGLVSADDLFSIERWVDARYTFRRYSALSVPLDGNEWVSVDDLIFAPRLTGGDNDALLHFKVDVGRALAEMLEACRIAAPGTQVGQCEQCKNLFVLNRLGQAYCSHRCGDTAARRKKRQSPGASDDLK